MRIEIYGLSGDVIGFALITEEAICHEELMTSDYVQLSWSDNKITCLPAGSYIIYNNERYSLLEPYNPLRENEAEYRYTPQFHSRIMKWDKIPVPLYTYESDGTTVKGREMDWEFTGSPADAMYMVMQAIRNETGENWTIQLSDSIPATITISSQSNSIFSLLTSIANECKTEWWADKSTNVLYLSQCKKGTELTLKVGDNVGVPTVTQSKDGYYTRFYVFGSTRNITQDYQGGQATNHIVNKRLTLDPIKYPGGYKDTKGHFDNGVFVSDLQKGEVFIKTLYFDDVYPKSKLTISDVRARLKYRLDTNGNKVRIGGTDEEPVYEQYAIWYFQISGLNFDPSTIIEEKELAVSFESGQLAGRDFKLTYHEKASVVNDSADFTPFNVKAGDFEINIDESTGNIIPGMAYIIPQNGDDVILYNIEMPDEYVASAQEELELELDKEMESYTCDNNSYEFDSYPVSFYDDGTDLNIGQSVAYVNGDKILHTRVIMVEKRLDFSFQQRIRIGNEIIKGNTQQLKEEVANVNQNIDVIKAFNELSISLSNAYANAQREMIEGFAAIKDIWEFDNDESHWTTDDSGNKIKTIKSKFNVWSNGYVSALGASGSSLGGSFDLLQEWDKYVDETAKSMALSAYLGKDLLDRVTSLEKGQKGHKITISGSGNVLVNVAESSDGSTLTFTKGNIDLSGYATTTALAEVSKKTDAVTTKVNDFLEGTDTDGIINKWKELEAFLNGQDQGTTLVELLTAKADKSIRVSAGTGLAGGGSLSADITLSLATVGTAGTYTKVTVDKYGRVTGHSSLTAADIPTLEISKINGLQAELNKKLNKTDFGDSFATEMAKWFAKDSEGNIYVVNEKGFYSNSFISALGLSASTGGSGASYDRLDAWGDYDSSKASWILSAKLGYDLNTRVSALEGGSAMNFEKSGTGNALTGFSKSGNTVTFTTGTFLTSHQKLYTLTLQRNGEGIGSYVPTADKVININACTAITMPTGFTVGTLSSVGVIGVTFASGYSLPTTAKQQQWDTAYSFVSSIMGSDADGVIDKWNEIISFLDGIGDSSTLEGLLNDINGNVTAVGNRVTTLEGYFTNGIAKQAAKTTGTLSINGKSFNGSANITVGTMGVAYGGTGKSSVASGSMLYASAANVYSELATTSFGRNLLKANSGVVVTGLNADTLDGVHLGGIFTDISWSTQKLSLTIGGVTNSVTIPYATTSVPGLVSTGAQTFAGAKTFNAGLIVPSGQSIKIGGGTITWDSAKGCFHISHGLYSDSFISALGVSDSTGGGGGSSLDRLDDWDDYSTDRATWVLSAKLGADLNTRLKSVEAGSATSVVMAGSGNAVTSITKSGTVITATKGSTFLLSSAYTAADVLAKIKTVDGSGSGLDADLLDGTHKSDLLTALSSSSATNLSLTVGGTTKTIADLYATQAVNADTLDGRHYTSFPLRIGGNLYATSSKLFIKLLEFSRSDEKGWLRISISDSNNAVHGICAKYIVHWTYNSTDTQKIISITCLYSSNGADVRANMYAVRTGDNSFELYYKPNSSSSKVGYVVEAYSDACTINNYTTSTVESITPTVTSTEGIIYTNINGALSGNASTATKLQTARTINGTSFDGTANITTAKWGTARNIYIRDASQAHTGAAVSVDGSATEYLLLPSTITATLVGNADTATELQTPRTINGTYFSGVSNITTSYWGVSRNIYIQDATEAHTGAAVSVNGSANVNLKLPSTITATLVGNASSATKLATARTLWGRSFDGTENVSGSLSGVGTITGSGTLALVGNDDIYLKRGGADNNSLVLAANGFRPFSAANNNIDLGSSSAKWRNLYVAGTANVGSITIGSGKITWDSTKNCFHFSHGLYSDSFVSALGANSSASGGGGSYERLDSWSDYSSDKATWVLSALLGHELNSRVSALEAGGATSVVTTGSGNVVTAVTKSGTVITATKGITALTSHQAIYALTLQGNGSTIGTFNPKSANATINLTAKNLLLGRGLQNPQTGRTQNFGRLYSYYTSGSAHENAPTTYTAVIGFGNDSAASVEIAGGWTSGMGLWYRALRDVEDDWFGWRKVLDEGNYASVLDARYYTQSEINTKLTNGSVTKVGTASVGSTVKPIYLNGGVPTALSANAGNSTHPVYLNAGAITQCGSTLDVSISGTAAKATALATARTINDVSFNGTANIRLTSMYTESLSGKTLSLDSLTLESGTPHVKWYLCATDGGGSGITDRPDDNAKNAFTLQCEIIRWASSADYITKQVYTQGSTRQTWMRFIVKGTATEWAKVLDSLNYTSYTVTKTGGGASGTWGIGISGNAATASKLTTTNAGSSTRPVYFSNGIPVGGAYSFGNGNGNAPVNNGTVCTNLNADMLDGLHEASFNRIQGRYNITTTGTAPYNYIHLFRIACSAGYSTLRVDVDFRSRYHAGVLAIDITTQQYPYGDSTGHGSAMTISKSNINGRSGQFYTLKTIQESGYNYYDVYYKSGTWNSGIFDIRVKGGSGTLVFEVKNTNLNSLPEGCIEVLDTTYSGNAASATKLATARTINGTSFDGTENITTAKWGTARTIYIQDASGAHGSVGVSVDGSTNYNLKLPSTITATLSGNASTATKLQTARTLWGRSFDGSANVSGDMTGVGNVTPSANGTLNLGTATSRWANMYTNCIEVYGTNPVIRFHYNNSSSVTDFIGAASNGLITISNVLRIYQSSGVYVDKGEFHVAGKVVIGSTPSTYVLNVQGEIGVTGTYGGMRIIPGYVSGEAFRIDPLTSTGTSNSNRITLLQNGNVCIGGPTITSYKLDVSGTIYSRANIIAAGAVTALVVSSSSDARLKNIIRDACPAVEDVADAPAVEFAWKKDGSRAVGSIAQYWQGVLPQAVHEERGYLAMQYDVIAMLASIANARRILSIEKKIRELEAEVKRLKTA